MNLLIRFTAIFAVLAVATLLVLNVGGALSSTELWHSALKVAKLVAIIFISSAIILSLAHQK